jgi:hypothetical protein
MRTTQSSLQQNNHLKAAHKGERRGKYKVCVRKPDRPLGKPRRTRENNINMDIQEVR